MFHTSDAYKHEIKDSVSHGKTQPNDLLSNRNMLLNPSLQHSRAIRCQLAEQYKHCKLSFCGH